jgi:foldase protein PrsA
MKRILTITFTAFLIASSISFARDQVDRVILVVNDQIVTLSEFLQEAKKSGIDLEEAGNEYKFLEQIIDKTIVEQEAHQAGITVTDEELDFTLKELKTRYKLNEKEMENALKKQNISEESFREQWRFQIITRKLMESKVKGNVAVTDQEIKEYYQQTYGDYEEGVSEIRIAHILILNDSPDALQKATKIAGEAKAGEDFPTLAKEYSQDTMSSQNGGDLGYFKKGDLVESLEFAVQDVQINEVVGPVESPGGYHIIKVLDKKDSKIGIPQSYSNEIRNTLYSQKAEEMLKNYLTSIKETAYIERKL